MKKVAVIMGSDSDWPVVQGACRQLDEFKIPYEAHIFARGRSIFVDMNKKGSRNWEILWNRRGWWAAALGLRA